MATLDLLGRRWSLRILWELRDEPLGARALRDRCDSMSPSVLYQRLRELTDAALVTQDDRGRYLLTHLGASLRDAIAPLDQWSRRWARTLAARPAQPDPRPRGQTQPAPPDRPDPASATPAPP
jgi:DNA-binding HxlR family transcriptional regulator